MGAMEEVVGVGGGAVEDGGRGNGGWGDNTIVWRGVRGGGCITLDVMVHWLCISCDGVLDVMECFLWRTLLCLRIMMCTQLR